MLMKNQIVYDLFCDASVGSNLRGSCSGVLATRRNQCHNRPDRIFIQSIDPIGTNNAGESCAVAMAVSIAKALNIYNEGNSILINIFSDSLITINGIREWMPNWIRRADSAGNFKNNSGTLISNQSYFKFIYNTLLEESNNGLKVNFLHQEGHIVSNVDRMRAGFSKFNNGLTPEDIGLTPLTLCSCNDFVDTETRAIINAYFALPDNIRSMEDPMNINKLRLFKSGYISDNSEDAIKKYLEMVKFKPIF